MKNLKPGDTLPDDAPDWLFVLHYAPQIRQEPRLLAGLKRPDGSPYLRPESVFCHTAASSKLRTDVTIKDRSITRNSDNHARHAAQANMIGSATANQVRGFVS